MKVVRNSVYLLALALALPAIASETGESAKYKVDGSSVLVNNHICASSHSPMEVEALGKFTNKVVYNGTDPKFKKFKGKTLVFNQCCEGCVGAFPKQWAENPEGILKYHGLDKKS